MSGTAARPLIIIVSGPPCTGKTSVGEKISKKFCLPLISKDGLKEALFDTLGWKDRAWSKKLGTASYELLWYVTEAMLAARNSLIVESNFQPEFENKTFLRLKKKYHYRSLQIMCETAGEVLLERFRVRSESGDRHPGHVDHLNYDEFKETLQRGKYEPLTIGGNVHKLDTTTLKAIDYRGLFRVVNLAVRASK